MREKILSYLLLVAITAGFALSLDAKTRSGYRLPASVVFVIDQDTLVLQRPIPDGRIKPAGDILEADPKTAKDTVNAATKSAVSADSLQVMDSTMTDSLQVVDTTFYSYDFYGEVIDSFLVVRDSAGEFAGYRQYDDTVIISRIPDLFWQTIDTVTLPYLDSMYSEYYLAMTVGLPDEKDIKRAEKKNKRDFRDSVKKAKPRVLATSAIPESQYYEQIITWTPDMNFNEIELGTMDTTFNFNFNEIPFFKKDVNATYLGTVGSASQEFNWFKRESVDVFHAFDPYISYSFTPENVPQYNTKTPYTELAYWGTLFETKKKEESQVKLLTTQNITPELNFTLGYRQYGAKGLLTHEETDNRTSFAEINYLGKRYLMNAGYIGQKIRRNENGGIKDPFWIKDTIVDAKTIDVNLKNAYNELKRRTVYLTHSLSIPMNFFRKDKDSLALDEGTMAFIGHSLEFSSFDKVYTDQIEESNTEARAFYNNQFFVDKTTSNDRMNVRFFENKFFIKLQPFAPDAIISRLNAGIGYQIVSIYDFKPEYYYKGVTRATQNNLYLYAGADGQFRNYFAWDADGKYNYAGYYQNDFELNGRVKLSLYPIKDGIHLTGKFNMSLKEPEYYQQHLFFNHHKWDNDFGKTTRTSFEASLEIPRTSTKATVDYALVDNLIYYDTLSNIRQHGELISVLSASLEQNVKLGILHLDNRALFQISSNEDVLPLPKLALNLKYYIEFPVVKDVMTMQLGVNGLLNSPFYAQDYAPDIGVFFNQKKELVGGWDTPYIDAFVNVQWKNVSAFVKYTNALVDRLTTDYFAAYHYIRPQSGFKFGVFWPFNIR